MTTRGLSDLDEIDRKLLRILSQNPRLPYSEIADRLKDDGHEMSGEGIRYRVSKLLEITSVFFLLAPEDHDWEIVRVGIEVRDEPDAKARAFEQVADLGFWLVCNGLGTTDIYAVATTVSNSEIDDLIDRVRAIEAVENVTFNIETERTTNIHNYFSTD